MNIFYEESGQFKTARIVQKTEAAYQADTLNGKRTKIKAANVFTEFDGDPAAFLAAAPCAAPAADPAAPAAVQQQLDKAETAFNAGRDA